MVAKNTRKYILYGTDAEAERFLYQNQDILNNISFCIGRNNVNAFFNLHVYLLSDINLVEYMETHCIIVVAENASVFSEMKKHLCMLGLREWDNYVWSRAINKKIVVINANCHGNEVEKYLRQSPSFNNSYMIYPNPDINLNEKREIPVDLLRYTDVYIHQDIRIDNSIGYKLSDDYVRQYLSDDVLDICIPNFVGMAGWMYPNLTTLDKTIYGMNNNPFYVFYRDEVLEEALKCCCSFEEIKMFWINYQYEEESLRTAFNKCMNRLKGREKNWDVKVYDFIMKNYKDVPCFTDSSHPSKYLMKVIGRQVANLLEIKDIDDKHYESDLGVKAPLLKCVSEYFHLVFQVPRELRKEYLGKWVVSELDDYIEGYLWYYHQIKY